MLRTRLAVQEKAVEMPSMTLHSSTQTATLPKRIIDRANNYKIILLWDSFVRIEEEWNLLYRQCPVSSCVFTTDSSLLDQSDVVVMYIDTMKVYPVNRRSEQRFVFFNMESPVNTNYKKLNVAHVRYSYFNWTMTYRWDSDIVLRTHYGYAMARSTYNGTGIRYTSVDDWSKKKPSNSSNDFAKSVANSAANVVTSSSSSPSISIIVKTKKKLVAWFVGHCSTNVRREEYVRQLSQYLPVDIFGQCSKNNKECPTDCDEMLRSDYKFYLSFENSWCPDYVTEKLYRPLLYDTVPIVMGGANYDRFAPPHSYINARDFSSAKELAAYLLLLDKSDELYAKYFDWKQEYYIIMPDLYGMCDLCRLANDKSMPPKVYDDITDWWSNRGNGTCEEDTTSYF